MAGLPELLIILVVVLIVFGAGRLPAVMKDLGKGIHSFKKGMNGEDAKEDASKNASKPKATKKSSPKSKK